MAGVTDPGHTLRYPCYLPFCDLLCPARAHLSNFVEKIGPSKEAPLGAARL
jgi:hypothetical protein